MAEHGPNMTQLIIKIMSYKAIPKGGGLEAGIEFLRNPEKRRKIFAEAEADAITAIRLIKSAPDNPYGTDDEVIAKVILDKMVERETRNRNIK